MSEPSSLIDTPLATVAPTPIIDVEPQCPCGRVLTLRTFFAEVKTPQLGCDVCETARVSSGEQVWSCSPCDYDVCTACSHKPPSRPQSPYPWLRRKEGRRGFVSLM